MRTLKSQNLVHDTNYSKFPEGTILNETATQIGTPIVREGYGDLLTNIYAFIKSRNINFNNLEDNEQNGYQLIEALKLLTNTLNDTEKVLSKNLNVWTSPLPLEILPDKYIFFAKSAENYVAGNSYTFKGNSSLEYPFFSSGFSVGDELMIVIDQNTVKAFSLTGIQQLQQDLIYPISGTPLSFSEGPFYYLENGKVFNDSLKVYDFESILQLKAPQSIIVDVIHHKNRFFCLLFDTVLVKYKFCSFLDSDLSTLVEVTSTYIFNDVNPFDYKPVMVADESYIYFTNCGNNTANNYSIIQLELDNSNTLNLINSFDIDQNFDKTTNIVFQNNGFYTLINGQIQFFHISGAPAVLLGSFPFINGYIFNMKNSIYYTNGEVAKKWNLELR